MGNFRVVLIAPSRVERGARQPGGKALFPPLALEMVAALTPPEAEVRIIDEAVEAIDFEVPADLVGITSMTAAAPRAYAVADRFRARGIPVCLGGMHPSACPEEAAQHADAVVIGEAEGLWPQVVADCRQGRLKQFYRRDSYPALEDVPIPRRDLLKPRAYTASATVQTTRGCPFACSFCAVTNFFGRTYRFRPVQKVVEEVSAIKERVLFLVDDNIMGLPDYARNLFSALAGCGKLWFSQASLTAFKDEGLLKLAQRAGCRGLFIGFESLSPEALQRVGKRFNPVARYREVVAKLHDAGIGVVGSFMFGLDGEGEDIFERTVDFVSRAKIDAPQFSILTPLPGTPLYAALEQQGRIVDRDWSHYNGAHVVFRPLAMSADRLQEGFLWAYRSTYSLWGIIKRFAGIHNRYSLFGPVNAGFRARAKQYLLAARGRSGKP